MILIGYDDTGNKDNICNTHSYQKELCDGLEMKLT